MTSRANIPTIYHLASSGGTAVVRLLHANYEVVVLSEVHPFFVHAQFAPANPIGLTHSALSYSTRDLTRAWNAHMKIVTQSARRNRKQLLMRVHSQTDFFSEHTPDSRIALAPWVGKGAVTVRDPLTNYVSAFERGFVKHDLGEWLTRCQSFLKEYGTLPRFRFEDVLSQPEHYLTELANSLELTRREEPLRVIEQQVISGDNRSRTPLTGEDFDVKTASNVQRILANTDYVAQVRANMSQLNDVQSALGYTLTTI